MLSWFSPSESSLMCYDYSHWARRMEKWHPQQLGLIKQFMGAYETSVSPAFWEVGVLTSFRHLTRRPP
jgi:hypothetical protein